MKVTYAWTVALPDDPSWANPGAPLAYHVRPSRQEAMRHFVSQWRTSDNGDDSAIWRRAYRRGWRLIRVAITPALGYAQLSKNLGELK